MDEKLIEIIAEALLSERYPAFHPIWEEIRYKTLYRQKADKLILEITRRGYKIVEDG